jgi:hypothetical protein
LSHAHFETVAESRVPATPGRFLEFQNATFRFAVLNECAFVRGSQILVLSTSDLERRISVPETQFKRRLVDENPNSVLALTVVIARTWRKGWAMGADAGGGAAEWTDAALHRSVQGQCGVGAGAAAGGGEHGGEG